MNYRHHFHAGNFADVMKHALLVRLARALQRKEKGFLYLDTHAGRGRYDLAEADRGDTREREPEWPAGIGRLLARTDVPESLVEYVELIRRFDRDQGHGAGDLRYYTGSPWIGRLLARPQDRLALCEKHPEEAAALQDEFRFAVQATVQRLDGYVALRAMLPPPERRALVLIDPPFEAPDEFAQVTAGLREALRRFPSGVYAVWYPLTERARVDEFFAGLVTLRPPPTLALEVTIAGEVAGAPKLRGCGLVVINPPWQFEAEVGPMLGYLARVAEVAPGGAAVARWLVPE